MKKATLFLVFLMCFAIVNGFCQEMIRTEVTWEIAANVINNAGIKKFGELNYYLSKSFVLIPDERNKVPVFVITDGNFIIKNQESTEMPIKFTIDLIGRFYYFNDARGSEFFEIIFKADNKDIPLKFQRNTQRDCFDLVSVIIDSKEHVLHSEAERPRLVIYYLDNFSSTPKVTATQPSVINEPILNRAESPLKQPSDRYPFTAHQSIGNYTEILGQGLVTKPGVVAYIMSKNHAVNRWEMERLIDTYFEEARKEGINPDIALAQMLHTTNFLRNRQRMDTHNYAGYESNYNFNNMPIGVQVHIQHLKGYASDRLNGHPVDPRLKLLNDLGYRGKVKTFAQLYGFWAPNSNYGNFINEILQGLYRYSGR